MESDRYEIDQKKVCFLILICFQFPGVLAYNISKAALDQFTRCVALELAPKQVRVNSVK